jgi:Zn-dependent M28 family amino/carboxypeptidase
VRPLGADSPARAPTSAEWVRIHQILDSLRALRAPRRDSVFNGADDDGSGTVALIEIAEAFAKGGIRPRRSILLVSHTAEEKGLRGSAWFTDHATVPLDSVVAEIDVDMIGRGAATDIKAGGPTYLEVVGLRRLSNEFGDWFEAINAREPLPFVFDYEYDAHGHPDQYYCRADHYSYARYGIPSVSLSRGSHMDYHQLTDEPQYIDYPDYTRLTKLVFDAALFVANADHAPRLSVAKPVNPHVPCRQ